MDNITMQAIVLCQIHVQAVEYILDDQTINSEQVCGSILHNHRSFKKEAVVSE